MSPFGKKMAVTGGWEQVAELENYNSNKLRSLTQPRATSKACFITPPCKIELRIRTCDGQVHETTLIQ